VPDAVALPHTEGVEGGHVQGEDPAQQPVALPERLVVERVAAGQIVAHDLDHSPQTATFRRLDARIVL
jgi:hypothetical protein